MITLFFNLYSFFMKKDIFINRLCRYLCRVIINYFDLIRCQYHYWIINKSIMCDFNSCNYVISLTSFPGRINNLWRIIETMINQKNVKANYMINLYLSKEQFPNKYEDLPYKLKKQQKRGLNILFVDEDLKAHKKYYYAMQKYSDKNIITIDDDIIYLSSFLSELINAHEKYPNIIVAQRARYICPEKSYIDWPLIKHRNILINNVLTTNGGGTLFPPGTYNREIFNKKVFKDICLLADDLWISYMCRIRSPLIYYIGNNVECVDIIISQKESLRSINNNRQENANDIQICNINKWGMNHFNVNFYLEKLL